MLQILRIFGKQIIKILLTSGKEIKNWDNSRNMYS